jgi:AcrR family transcriptional regulator
MPRKRMTRAERAAHTRKLLMAAASKICAKHGLERASIDQVAEEAGFTKGAFYANFRSKEELFLAMLDERFAEQLKKFDEQMAGEGEISDQARDAAVDFAHELSDDPEWIRLYFQFAAHAARDESFRAELNTRNRALRARMAEIIARRSERIDLEPVVDPAELALMADAIIDGFAMHALLDPEEFPEDLHGKIWMIYVAGLKALSLEGEQAAAVR